MKTSPLKYLKGVLVPLVIQISIPVKKSGIFASVPG